MIQIPGRLNHINDLKIDACRFLARRLALLGLGNDCLAKCQDNVTEWDIRLWCWWPGFPVGQQYKATVSVHCHKSVRVLM